MTRLPHGIPEEVLMQFVTAVVLVTVTVAFVAYVATWISARRQRVTGAAAENAGTDQPGEPTGGLAAGRPEANGRARRAPSHMLCVGAVATATALAAVAPAGAHEGPSLSGHGTAVIDGAIGAGEWDAAARYPFAVTVPANDGGGTTPATLSVMNDGVNLYVALELLRPGPVRGSFNMEFDNDHDGRLFEEGDDAFVANGGVAFFDDFRSMQPPCPANVVCGFLDTQGGGTTDGRSVAVGNGTVQVFEVERPLDSADDLHDFSLAAGDTVGFHAWIRIFSLEPACNFGPLCMTDTRIPSFGTGDIVINAGADTPPQLTPEAISVGIVEGHGATELFSVRNTTDHQLDLTVGVAPEDCDAPGNVRWLTVPTEVAVAAGGLAEVPVSIDPSGLEAPDHHAAKVCISLQGGAVLELPVTVRVLYPFAGFLSTFANPPTLNAAHADGVQTFWFRLGGDRGLGVVTDATSRRIECSTAAPIGPLEPAETPSWTGLWFQPHTGRYAFPWTTTAAVKNTCRELALTLADGSVHTAWLHFVK